MLPSERAEARKQKHSSPFLSSSSFVFLSRGQFSRPSTNFMVPEERPTDHDYSLLIPLDTLMRMRVIFQSERVQGSSVFSLFLSPSLSLFDEMRCFLSGGNTATTNGRRSVRPNRAWSGAGPFVFGGAPDHVHALASPVGLIATVRHGTERRIALLTAV